MDLFFFFQPLVKSEDPRFRRTCAAARTHGFIDRLHLHGSITCTAELPIVSLFLDAKHGHRSDRPDRNFEVPAGKFSKERRYLACFFFLFCFHSILVRSRNSVVIFTNFLSKFHSTETWNMSRKLISNHINFTKNDVFFFSRL